MPEEPYESIAHVRICGEAGWVTGRLYPELGPNRNNRFHLLASVGGWLNVAFQPVVNFDNGTIK
ncbi:MAG: hypothetical protein ACYSSN_11175 [Planctomycetota bacterium]|jgi:hypothetical protein